jgi:AcrR family transcriptional regulator
LAVRTNPQSSVPAPSQPSFIEAARRRQIIDCAIETIAELGYERASLAEIGKRAGISKGNVTYYFPNKDELIDQVVVHVYTRAADYMLPRLGTLKTATATLRTFIITNVEFIRDNRTAVRALIEIISRSRTAEGKPRYDVEGQEQVVSDVEHILRWGQETGEFRAFSTPVYAVAIRIAIDALGPRLQVYPELDVDEYGRELADLFERAVIQELQKEK